jgi:hypothetical protein
MRETVEARRAISRITHHEPFFLQSIFVVERRAVNNFQ